MADNNGLLYYKKNFNQTTGEVENPKKFNAKIESSDISPIAVPKSSNFFQLETTYPGLLMGTGYTHHAKGNEDAYKIGFFFDFTTGMPIIPGSSLKGVLRSVFPQFTKEDIKKIENGAKPGDETSIVKARWIYALLEELKKDNLNESTFINTYYEPNEEFSYFKLIHDLELELFETAKNVFYDIIPIRINGNNNGDEEKLFASDYLAPHVHPLKNPDPLKFLKVLPKVVFLFSFKLHGSSTLTTAKYELLFKKIILTIGLGAKTNVGYGQFSEVMENNNSLVKRHEHRRTENNKDESDLTTPVENTKIHPEPPENIFPPKAIPFLIKGKEFIGNITEQIGEWYMIHFMVNDIECVIRKKPTEKLILEKNTTVKLICSNSYTTANHNISVKNI